MQISTQSRLLLSWFGLSAVTLLAWWIGAHHGTGPLKPDLAVAFGAISITAVKVRVILREFMDVRHAPARLRHMSDALLALFIAALTTAYIV